MPPSPFVRRRVGAAAVSPSKPYSSPTKRSPRSARCRDGRASHVRVVARIRPLNGVEEDARYDMSVYPQDSEEESPHDPVQVTDAAEESKTPFKLSFLNERISTDATPIVTNGSRARTNLERIDEPLESSMPAQQDLFDAKLTKSVIAEVSDSHHKRFDLDGVFGPAATQKDVYDLAVGDAIPLNILRGYSTTIIAYGQTGSGKTYTMGGPGEARTLAGESPRGACCSSFQEGNVGANGIGEDSGVIPRAVHDVFKVKNNGSAKGIVEIRLSCLEIYNDELRDLLVEGDEASPSLVLRDYGDEEGVFVKGVRTVEVESIEQVKYLMDLATRRRTTGRTHLNEYSSRSHAVCTLEVTIQPTRDQQSTQLRLSTETIMSKLTLVDLAGSERLKASGVDGIQQQESININKDLFVLGKVVSALSGKEAKWHVPYRDSKLTRLLRDSLGGNCFTVLIACVKPSNHDVDESVNTLRYAERARSITNSIKPNIVNTNMSPAECVSMRAENRRLKTQILHLRKRLLAETSKRSSSNLLDQAHKSDEDAADSELSGLQAKLKKAGDEAKVARETCHSVSQTADRLRQRYANTMMRTSSKMLSAADRSDSIASCLSYELSMTPSDDISLVDDDSLFGWNPPTRQGSDPFHDDTDGSVITEGDRRQSSEQIQRMPMSDRLATMQSEVAAMAGTRNFVNQGRNTQRVRGGPFRDLPRMYSTGAIMRTFSADSGVDAHDGIEMCSVGRSSSPERTVLNSKIENLQNQIEQERKMHSTKIQEMEKQLEQEQSRQGDLKRRCKNLTLDVQCLTTENTALHKQNDSLQDAIELLRKKLEPAEELQLSLKSEGTLSTDTAISASAKDGIHCSDQPDGDEQQQTPVSINVVDKNAVADIAIAETIPASGSAPGSQPRVGLSSPERERVRQNAERMLIWADKAISWTRASSRSFCSTVDSSVATELRPVLEAGSVKEPGCKSWRLPTRPPKGRLDGSNQVIISNIDRMDENQECTCVSSMFTGNAEHVEFFLPKLSVTCSCGKHRVDMVDESDPCALRNILRDWQVDFLNSVSIHDPVSFMHAYKQRAGLLAKEMRRWRKEQNMLTVKTSSCGVALHVWYRTVKKAKALNGNRDFLDVTVLSDNRTVSTLGVGSACADARIGLQ